MTTASDSNVHPRCSYGYTSGVLRHFPCIHGHLHRLVKIECEKCGLTWKMIHQFSNVRRCLLTATAILSLTLTACFEPPVKEQLDLEFLPGGEIMIRVTGKIDKNGSDRKNPILARRLRDLRKAVEEGWDPWSKRFHALSPSLESRTLEKAEGRLIKYEYKALIKDPDTLRDFFATTDLRVFYQAGDNGHEFSLIAEVSTRATREQRRQVEAAMEKWCGAVSTYLKRIAKFYTYLELHPERSRCTFGHLLSDLLSFEEKDALKELTEDEEEFVKELQKSMEAVYKILLVPDTRAFTLNELSHLAYNPFPAEIHVRIHGLVDEVEGFISLQDGSYGVEGLGLWESLKMLQGHWIEPDPLLTLVDSQLSPGDKKFNLDAYAERPRRMKKPPTSANVKEKIEEGLTPAGFFRIAWHERDESETTPNPPHPSDQ